MQGDNTIYLDGETLSSSEVQMIAECKASVAISQDSWIKIDAARSVVEGILERGETVYGINTGFGALVKERISSEDLAELQRNLVRSHATALGDYMSRELVRAMMVTRANSLAKGCSGVHPDVLNQLLEFINKDICPAIPRIGSLGASGDLAPLSHMALSLIGEGDVLTETGVGPTRDALIANGLIGIQLKAKDGLSLINGTSQMLSFLVAAEQRLSQLLPLADIIMCTSLEARKGSIMPADERVHLARPHIGQLTTASRLRMIMENSPILQSHTDCEQVQDAYSFRCGPQVHGAVLQRFMQLQETLEVELNSATDNPLVFPVPANPVPHEVISQ